MSLNITKTQFMLFSGFKNTKPSINLKIEGESISETVKSKFILERSYCVYFRENC